MKKLVKILQFIRYIQLFAKTKNTIQVNQKQFL